MLSELFGTEHRANNNHNKATNATRRARSVTKTDASTTQFHAQDRNQQQQLDITRALKKNNNNNKEAPLEWRKQACVVSMCFLISLASFLLLPAAARPKNKEAPLLAVSETEDPTTRELKPIATRKPAQVAVAGPTLNCTPAAAAGAPKKRPAPTSRQLAPAKSSGSELSSLFCEHSDEYPRADIRAALEGRAHDLREIFDASGTPLDPRVEQLSERRANADAANTYRELPEVESAEQRVCASAVRSIVPQRAKNKDNEWVFVVNEADFMQVVRVEVCESAGSACAYLEDNLPVGMSSECKQIYAYKKLLAMHPLDKRMLGDVFRFPSCCACYVRGSYELRNLLSAPHGQDSAPPTTPLVGRQPLPQSQTKIQTQPPTNSPSSTATATSTLAQSDPLLGTGSSAESSDSAARRLAGRRSQRPQTAALVTSPPLANISLDTNGEPLNARLVNIIAQSAPAINNTVTTRIAH